MLHVVILTTFYAALFGWKHRRLIKEIKQTEPHKEFFYIYQLYFFAFYALALFKLGYEDEVLVCLFIATFFNILLLERYWVKHRKLREAISSSMTMPVVKLVLVSIVTTFSIWYSGKLIEEITWIPATTLSDTVLVLSILMAIVIYIGISMFSFEILAILMIVNSIFRVTHGKSPIFKLEIIVSIMMVVPFLLLFKYSSDTLFSTEFIKEQLYSSYHRNLIDPSQDRVRCNLLPAYAKIQPISDFKVSYSLYNSSSGVLEFGISNCNKEHNEN